MYLACTGTGGKVCSVMPTEFFKISICDVLVIVDVTRPLSHRIYYLCDKLYYKKLKLWLWFHVVFGCAQERDQPLKQGKCTSV